MPWSVNADWSRPARLAILGAFGCAAVAALLAPATFWLPLVLMAGLAVGVLIFRHIVVACAAWLLIAGLTLEMTLSDLVGPAAYQPTIAAVKAAEFGLALLCIARYGLYPDLFNPGLAFVAMFIAGLAHGLHHDLTPAASLRSLLGSVAPFAFAFSRLSAGWATVIIRTTAWIPLASVAGGVALDLAGFRPALMESGGARLAGLGHPAFLAGVALAAIYACLIELFRDGRSRWLVLLAANLLILVATGARAARLWRRRHWPHLRLRPFQRLSTPPSHAAPAARRLPAADRGGAGAGPADAAAVQPPRWRGGESERSGIAVAGIPPGRGLLTLVRLGRGRRQCHHTGGQRTGADHPKLGRAQRVSPRIG
jgi:hypothetical protein